MSETTSNLFDQKFSLKELLEKCKSKDSSAMDELVKRVKKNRKASSE